MDKQLENTLIKVSEALNKSGILWSIGASLLLNQYRLADKPSDIDILVSCHDVDKADYILSEMGRKETSIKNNDVYGTKHFHEYVIESINVDLMADLTIKYENRIVSYIFDKKSVPHNFCIRNASIPFSTLEDWFVLYHLMPGKAAKSDLIYNYLIKNGVKFPDLLERWKDNQELSEAIKQKINNILLQTTL